MLVRILPRWSYNTTFASSTGQNLKLILILSIFLSVHQSTTYALKLCILSPDEALYWGLDWSENIGCCWKSEVCQCPWRAPSDGAWWRCEARRALPPEPSYVSFLMQSRPRFSGRRYLTNYQASLHYQLQKRASFMQNLNYLQLDKPKKIQ